MVTSQAVDLRFGHSDSVGVVVEQLARVLVPVVRQIRSSEAKHSNKVLSWITVQ